MSGDPRLSELTAKVATVSDIFAARCDIRRHEDWYLLKLQEELGELTAEALRASGRARRRDESAEDQRLALEDEAADLFAMLLLFCRHHDIDIAQALERKWFKYLPHTPLPAASVDER